MIQLDNRQERVYKNFEDLAEYLACKHACIEADHNQLLVEADRSLRVAIVNYDKLKHGDFEEYATQLIERDLQRYIHSNGNGLFVITRTEEDDDEEEEEECEESALEYEINRILRDAGFKDDEGLGEDEFVFS